MAESYYNRLEIKPSASLEEVKTAYRRQARKFHPDVDPSPLAATHFKQVAEAYATLSDSRKRLSYNQTLLTTSSAELNQRSELNPREFWAAWERILAYLITGLAISTVMMGTAQWLGAAENPWNLQTLLTPAIIGAALGLLWGIDANFVVGDFLHRAALGFMRLVRLAAWTLGLGWLTHQSLIAIRLGEGSMAGALTRDATIAAVVVGLIIAIRATLKDH